MSNIKFNTRLDAIEFINESTFIGKLTGRLTIGYDRNRRDISTYALHWGKDEQTPIEANSLIAKYGAKNKGWDGWCNYVFYNPLIYLFADKAVPAGASHLLVFAIDYNGQKHLYASRRLVNQQHLLPPSATLLERNLAATSARLSQLPVQVDTLWDPSRCPEKLLPWLAWACSVDLWVDNKEDVVEESKRRREIIHKSAFVHQHKGTKAAIQQALSAFADVSITVTEWWQQTPRGVPHTFNLDLLVNANLSGIGSADLNEKIRRAVDAVKPVRSHYTFTFSTVQSAVLRIATTSQAVSYKRFTMAAAINTQNN